MRLIGGYLMSNRTSYKVPLMYLLLLEDFQLAGQYSWGLVVLAQLCGEMCNAMEYINKEIGGCLTLLHLWAWDRFPILAPSLPPYPDPKLELYPIRPPLNFRFNRIVHYTYLLYFYYISLYITTIIA